VSEGNRITTFWRWWQQHSAPIAEAIEAGTAADLGTEISIQVGALHPSLQWELTPGHASRHALVVTSGGTPELRPLAERWFQAAPPADDTWEYHPSRVADPSAVSMKLEFGPHVLDLSQAEVGISIDDERQLVDVSVYHSAFDEMTQDARGQVTYLILDWLLGEDGVERWVGEIESRTQRPDDALPMDALAETIEALARRNPEGEWVLLEGRASDGSVLLVTARRPLKWIDYPLLDQHIAVSVSYSERNPAGLPEPGALARLRATEDELLAALGDSAVLAAVETVNGTRTFHLYADSQDATARERATRWADATRGAQIEIAADPGWGAVRPYA
jgi:Family of unknown function (DUF695)